jgi:hypothetical protein
MIKCERQIQQIQCAGLSRSDDLRSVFYVFMQFFQVIVSWHKLAMSHGRQTYAAGHRRFWEMKKQTASACHHNCRLVTWWGFGRWFVLLPASCRHMRGRSMSDG